MIQKILSLLFVTLFIFSCGTTKHVESLYSKAESNYSSSNYQAALSNYKALILDYNKTGQEIPNEFYTKVAECAEKTGDKVGALNYLKTALNDSLSVNNLETYLTLSKEINNTDTYIADLDEYKTYLIDNDKGSIYYNDIFEAAIESKNYDKILSTYPEIEQLNESQCLAILKAFEVKEKDEEALSFARKTSNLNPEYYKVKTWEGAYYYKNAEAWYKKEMDQYNKNKTYNAYIDLKRSLKKITKVYKEAQDVFEPLHSKFPENKTYIKYLRNIYLRLEMKDDATKMTKLIG